jgi:hypothetical protein
MVWSSPSWLPWLRYKLKKGDGGDDQVRGMESRFRRSLPLSDLCQGVVVMVNNYHDMRTFVVGAAARAFFAKVNFSNQGELKS